MKKTSILTLTVSIVLVLLFVYSLFFVKTKFTVNFINNGEIIETVKFEKDDTLKFPNLEEENKKLVGWYYNGNEVTEETKVTNNMNIEAKFEEITTTTTKKKKR